MIIAPVGIAALFQQQAQTLDVPSERRTVEGREPGRVVRAVRVRARGQQQLDACGAPVAGRVMQRTEAARVGDVRRDAGVDEGRQAVREALLGGVRQTRLVVGVVLEQPADAARARRALVPREDLREALLVAGRGELIRLRRLEAFFLNDCLTTARYDKWQCVHGFYDKLQCVHCVLCS